jgi:hypothetical protein
MTIQRLLAILVLSIASSASAADAPLKGWTADPALVAELQKRRPERMIDESKVPPYVLPDALRFVDGRMVTNAQQWPQRRAEILELLRSEMFGRSPGRPKELTFDVIARDPAAWGGAATLKRVAIVSRQDGRSHRFDLVLFTPNARPKAPAFLLINNRDPEKNTDWTRRAKSEFWPVEEMIARGYGMACIQNRDLAPDVKTDNTSWRTGIVRLFEGDPADRPNRPADAWMALAAWAWGASRSLDYLETDPAVDAKRVAVLGHSRGGKTALWAGAEDERFGMVISNNSGSCGAAISRRKFGERIKLTHTNPHWFCDNFRKYHDREDDLPFDQHMLIALSAPRPVYVTSATEDLWADPRGEFLGLAHSSSVYALWGYPAIAPDAMPPADTPLIAGPRGYHIRTGPHNLTAYDWARFADFADGVWKRGG